jgi:NAD(P)H-flavin reductase
VPATLTATLRQVDAVTPRSRLMTLDLGRQPLAFHAGQAVLVGPPGSTRRAYSIASSPEHAAETGTLEVLVGLGGAEERVHPLASLAPGAAVEVEGPLGSFLFPPDPAASHLLFIAGGTGIAPLRAMLEHARRAHPTLRAALMYSARRADEFAFLPEFETLAAAGQLELHRTVTRDDEEWGGQRGRIGRAHFEAVMHDPGHTLCFVCGPPQMVGESVATLMALGVPDEAIRREEWNRK